ncbi:UNVERIFIED_CONTAM: hypothetical protein N8J90_04510 [Halobacillus marinus]|uniref:hypothetical protein n=1 Tax=Halobacillus sp. KGW1 TaxID=1793726 RepID=UPI000785FC34|nr:hypothetical protein [Halobacillus sp. KGW1]
MEDQLTLDNTEILLLERDKHSLRCLKQKTQDSSHLSILNSQINLLEEALYLSKKQAIQKRRTKEKSV